MMDKNYKNNTYLQDYYAAIKSGKIIAGRSIIDLLEILLEDMESDEYIFNTEQADIRISFIESCCKLTKADFYGKPFRLELWQKAFITAVYSYYTYIVVSIDENDNEIYGWVRRFTECLILIARKNGKTELMAALALAELVLSGQGIDICCGSNDDEQSKILFNAVGEMKVQADPHEKFIKQTQKNIKCTNRSTLFRMSSKMRNLEGRLLPKSFLDECCMAAKDDPMAKAVIQSTSVLNDALVYYLTSEGMIIDGFLDSLTSRGHKILKREDDDDKRFLPWMYLQDETETQIFDAMNQPNGWRLWQKSNPNLGKIKKISYMENELKKAQNDRIHRIWVMNKDFSIKQSSAAAFLEREMYEYETESWSLEDFRDCVCICGVDMAEIYDLNAASFLFLRRDKETGEIGKEFYIHTKYFIPSAKLEKSNDAFDYKAYPDEVRICDGVDVDTKIIADYCFELFTMYGIIPLITGYDLKFAHNYRSAMEAYGFPLEIILQNAETLNNAIRYTEQLFRYHRVNYQQNAVTKWCISNATLLLDSKGKALLTKINNDKRRRIDGIVSITIAIEAYNRHREEFHALVK